MSRYLRHEILVAPARPTSELWRLGLGVVGIVALYFVFGVAYVTALRNLPDWPTLGPELASATTPRAMWLLLLNFGCLILALWVVLRVVHRRGLLSVIGPVRVAGRDFGRVTLYIFALFVVLFLLPVGEDFRPIRNMSFGVWMTLLPMSALMIMVQISAEEMVFRGYLQSQLAARFSSPWIWMLVPSALFGALHYEQTIFGENAAILAVWSGLFGVAAADLTARAGNLGPALALHFANNFSAMMVTSMQGQMDGLALYVMPFGPDDAAALRALLPLEAGVILCVWLVARIAIRR